jgi:hypothetical protein
MKIPVIMNSSLRLRVHFLLENAQIRSIVNNVKRALNEFLIIL